MSNVDAVDRRLLEAIRNDARRSVADLAQAAGVSRATAHERLKRLRENGVIKGTRTLLDPEALGHPLRAILLVHLMPDAAGDQREIAGQIAAIPDVDRVHVVTGRYDFLVEVLAKDMDEIGQVILERIRTLDGVGNTESLICFWSFDGPGITIGDQDGGAAGAASGSRTPKRFPSVSLA